MENREVSQLKVNPNNPRGDVVVDDSLRELAASIQEQGVLQPILITPDGVIVCGHRRVKACELAGQQTIPCVVRELTEQQQIQVMLIENLQRKDLTALQTARAYQLLIDHGLSIREISKATGFRPESISRHLNILKLHPDLHGCFDGEFGIPLGGIRYLLEIDESRRLEIGLKCKEKGWSIAKLRRVAEKLNPTKGGRRVDRGLLDRIWERVEDGCYTPETINQCSECGRTDIFHLTNEQIQEYLQRLVDDGRAEWRKQGGKKDMGHGAPITLCVPADLPTGAIDFSDRRRLAAGNEYAR